MILTFLSSRITALFIKIQKNINIGNLYKKCIRTHRYTRTKLQVLNVTCSFYYINEHRHLFFIPILSSLTNEHNKMTFGTFLNSVCAFGIWTKVCPVHLSICLWFFLQHVFLIKFSTSPSRRCQKMCIKSVNQKMQMEWLSNWFLKWPTCCIQPNDVSNFGTWLSNVGQDTKLRIAWMHFTCEMLSGRLSWELLQCLCKDSINVSIFCVEEPIKLTPLSWKRTFSS